MGIRVLYFAALREAVGCAEESLEAHPGETVADLRRRLAARGGDWQALATMKNLKAAINQAMAPADATIRDGDEVAFFPPVTGG